MNTPVGQPIHCKGCSRTCAGGCYAVNFEQTGDHFTPFEENCLFWVVGQEIKGMFGRMRSNAVPPDGFWGRQ
ncbi:MAG: hypothetical protein M1609_08050 [Firmicutes bacterium]|nr:hypothetical protein [Bacillota bacterium]